MTQTILNFKLETTDEKLTPRTGVAIFGEYLNGLGFKKCCNTFIPLSVHHKAYTPFEFIFPLILMLHSGGRVLDDIKEIRFDKALQTVLKMKNIPTAGAITKYLHRHRVKGETGIKKINKHYLKRFLKSIKNEKLILDIDAAFIESHKSTARYSYKKEPGYMPMVGHINGGYIIEADFREGNTAPADKNLEFIKQCAAKLPSDRKFDRFRADSASYQASIMNYCDNRNIKFTISGQQDSSVRRSIANIKDESWQKLSNTEQIAEFVHTMGKTDNAFRMIVVKRETTLMLPLMLPIMDECISDEKYYTIATNDNTLTPEEIVQLHRQRGETSENKIKELKNGFNMSYLPTSNFQANAFYFAIGTLAYNLFLLFKQILDEGFKHHTVRTIRYKLYNIAGKTVTHARETILKVNKQFEELFCSIRARAYQVSLQC